MESNRGESFSMEYIVNSLNHDHDYCLPSDSVISEEQEAGQFIIEHNFPSTSQTSKQNRSLSSPVAPSQSCSSVICTGSNGEILNTRDPKDQIIKDLRKKLADRNNIIRRLKKKVNSLLGLTVIL